MALDACFKSREQETHPSLPWKDKQSPTGQRCGLILVGLSWTLVGAFQS